jgi:uncharacterized protein with PQ loop repeat
LAIHKISEKLWLVIGILIEDEILAIHEISEKLWLVIGILIEDSDYGISHSSISHNC